MKPHTPSPDPTLSFLELKYKPNPSFEFSSKLTLTNTKYIYLKYPPKTEHNEFSNPIYFQITIFPPPVIRSIKVTITNTFVYPSLYDNSDLLESILQHKWNANEPHIMTLIEIIECIPRFIKKLVCNIKKRVCIYYGKYYYNQLYYMNDFIENSYMNFYKAHFYPLNNVREKRLMYVVVTDIYILLFEINNDSNACNYGTLLNMYELVRIKTYVTDIYHSSKRKYSVMIIFNNVTSLEIVLENCTNEEFIDNLKKKCAWLKERYTTFKEYILYKKKI